MIQRFTLHTENQRQLLTRFIASLDILHEPHEALVYPYKGRRTHAQNRFYWALLNDLADRTPHAAEVWHEYFKRTFIGVEETEIMGQHLTMGMSTTDLSVGEFTDYVTKVQAWISQHTS